MEKLYTIHLTDWLAKNEPAIIEKETGLNFNSSYQVYSRFANLYRHDKDFLSKFEILYDVNDEPHPVPFFVSEYKLSWKKGILGAPHLTVTPVLTEQGVLRRAWEQGEQLEKARKNMPEYRNTPFGPMYY